MFLSQVILIQSDQQSGGDGDRVILRRPHTLILRANTTSRQDYNLDYVTVLAAQLRLQTVEQIFMPCTLKHCNI